MRHWSRYVIGLVLIALCACSHEEEAGQEALSHPAQGFLLRLTDDTDVNLTRGTPAELGVPTAAQFSLAVHSHKTDKDIYTGPYTEELIRASAGTYTLTVTCGEDVALAMDAPYYYGTTDAEVIKDETTQVTLTCRVANSLVSIVYANAELFDQLYSSYGVSIKVGNRSLTLDSEAHASRSAYFPAQSTEVSATFVATTTSGTAVELPLDELQAQLPLAAADHAVITLKASNTGLQVEKVEVKKESIAATIPLEWYPKPKVNGFAEGATSLEYIETEDALTTAIIDYTASTPTQDVELTLNLGDENLSPLNGTYLISALTDEQRTALTNAGITLPTLGNQGDGISLNALTAKLITNAGADVINKVGIRVKANNRWSSEIPQEYQVVTKKPEFAVDAYPGNIWTKEFTLNEVREEQVTKGNYAKLISDMSYQFSEDGNTWSDLVDGRRQNGLTAATSYHVRPIYRGKVPGIESFIETYPETIVSNGNFEIYSQTEANNSYGIVYTWADWASTNDLTVDNATGIQAWNNSRSGVQPITGSNARNGVSVWIATIGWGYGAWIGNSKYNDPCELYLGTITNVNHNSDTATKTYGISYNSHPTHLSFWYKYIPYDNDKSDIAIEVLSDDKVLGNATLQQSSTIDSYTNAILEIAYDTDLSYKKLTPNKISIRFKSGFNQSTKQAKINDVKYVGSQLFIDDVSLIYDK